MREVIEWIVVVFFAGSAAAMLVIAVVAGIHWRFTYFWKPWLRRHNFL